MSTAYVTANLDVLEDKVLKFITTNSSIVQTKIVLEEFSNAVVVMEYGSTII
jgi:hypothetical protein